MKRVYFQEELNGRARKMARIEEVQQENIVEKSQNEVSTKFTEDAAKIVVQDYILNDFNAIEKKWNLRNIEAIQVSEEAVNGSNVRVVMKTSVFEVVKNNFLAVLETDPNIEKVETKRTVKAKSANGGSAEVEYIFDIILNKDGVKHEIVFTCYNTTNRFQIQKRGKHEKFQSL